MRLSAKVLKNVANVNNWEYANSASVQEGQANEIYVQLVDLDKVPGPDKSVALPEHPMRYIPQGTTIGAEATFPSIDDADVLVIIGTQPFADDKSIWKFDLTDAQLPKSGNFKIKLTEDANEKNILVKGGVSASLLNVGSC
ncbi:MAG TPA: hypothetical protein DDY18_06920 [Flavobacterium sp.]|jgi:hypothetical protein|nr:hypothetical protein [Flavobacterium sp.]